MTGLSVSEGVGPFKQLRRALVPICGLIYALFKASKSAESYPQPQGALLANFAMGYVITGEKHT